MKKSAGAAVGRKSAAMDGPKAGLLQSLAEMSGIQTSFRNAAGKIQNASDEALSAILGVLGVPAGNEREIVENLRLTRLRRYRRGIEPVLVAWNRRGISVRCHIPVKPAEKTLRTRIRLEDGSEIHIAPRMRAVGMEEIEGERFETRELALPPLDFGYHTLEISAGSKNYHAMVVSAPTRSYAEPGLEKSWGAFLPMYAAHSEKSWGAGNVSDWERLSCWLGGQGARVAGTLPLLAAFLDYPVCEPSPYSPASRLFWNEFYLDVERAPEFATCGEAQGVVRSRPFQKKLDQFRRSELIDYGEQWKARREVLELLARHFFSRNSPRRARFEEFLRERPEAEDYAEFRAACEKFRTSWHNWPGRRREGRLSEGDYREEVKRFHLYVQWLAQEQVSELARRGEQNGVKLYLDLPLGVNPDGYDVWRERDSFALKASAGAPPDLFFSKGQDWGFAPLHPQQIRENGYRHVLAYLRFQMRQARLLRIDHVMGLHRLYWVPHGFGAKQGAYVKYAAEELHAIFNLESHRNRTLLIGENLGTVPEEVNQSMKRHGMHGMYVEQFEERPDPKAALARPPALSVASLNTHDTPTFAARWTGKDIADRVRLGLLTREEGKREKRNRARVNAASARFLKSKRLLKNRRPSPREVLRALLGWLWNGDAEIVLVTIEDLWLETKPQNVPGTSSERPNWRRKARFTLEKLFRDKGLRHLIPF